MKRLWLLPLAASLGACWPLSSGPSEDDALNAVVADRELGNMGSRYKYTSFKLNECKEAVGTPGYVCDMSWTYNGAYPRRGTARFVKNGDSWQAVEWK